MALTNCWRGTVGVIQPNFRPGSTESLIRMLPDGIGVIPLHLDADMASPKAFRKSIPACEKMVAKLAELEVDAVHLAESPPFYTPEYEGERALMKKWERTYRCPVFTNGMTYVHALQAFKARRIVGVSYFPQDLNGRFARYFKEAGLDVLAMDRVDESPARIHAVASSEIYRFIKQRFLPHRRAQAICMLGGAWRTLDIIERLEGDLGVPVIHHIPAQSWEIQKRLHVRQPVPKLGRLLAEMP